MTSPATDLLTKEPWFARNRDKLFVAAFILLLLSVLGLLPSPVSRGITQLIEEHAGIVTTLQVQCVHDAKTTQERAECLTGRLPTP